MLAVVIDLVLLRLTIKLSVGLFSQTECSALVVGWRAAVWRGWGQKQGINTPLSFCSLGGGKGKKMELRNLFV